MKKLVLLFSIIAILYCCTKEEAFENESFNEKQLLIDLSEHVLLPSINSFQQNCSALASRILDYETNTTNENLQYVRNQWIKTAKNYARIYSFNIGIIKRSFTHQKLYNWPSFANSIENNLNQNSTISISAIHNFGSSSKGLPGIEYLLFKTSDLTTANAEFTNQVNRLEYLRWSSSELEQNATQLKNDWDINNGNYITSFIENELSSIEGSFNMLYNGIYNIIDNAKVTKVGKPAGLETSATTNTFLLQAPYSGISAEMVLENLKITEELFYSTDGLNISNYLDFKSGNDELSTLFHEKIENCRTKINLLHVPLREAIRSEKAAVAEIHIALKEVQELLAIQIRAQLVIVITSTDNDGD
jgi:predicted lipoprotein